MSAKYYSSESECLTQALKALDRANYRVEGVKVFEPNPRNRGAAVTIRVYSYGADKYSAGINDSIGKPSGKFKTDIRDCVGAA